MLNNREMWKNLNNNNECCYWNCAQHAIKSHIYSKEFLKKISNKDNNLYIMDLEKIYNSKHEKAFSFIISEKHINKVFTAELFCEDHDCNVFKRIEKLRVSTRLEDYLYLYAYRLFIFDYYFEYLIKVKDNSKIFSNKSFGIKITSKEKEEHKINQIVNQSLNNLLYNFTNFEKLKNIFDIVFKEKSEPNFGDFNKYFDMKYYKLNCKIDFLASGVTAFANNGLNINDHIPSIYALVPDQSYEFLYFIIVTPKIEIDQMNFMLNFFDTEYKKYINQKESNFMEFVLFTLLDCSQNFIFTEEFYDEVTKNNDFEKIENAYWELLLARGDTAKSYNHREKALSEINSLKYLKRL